MKIQQLLAFLLLLPTLSTFSQSALDFDGADDGVSVNGGAGLVANGPISLAFWVYPTNPTPNFPNFDGFAGIRNNSNADFYILQLTASNVEARFRNSDGVNFDITYDGLVLNEWNHFALTYDLSTLTLYHNGEPTGSIAANGVITNGAQSFDMGFLTYFTNTFSFDGKLDDVGLYNQAISAADVETLYTSCQVPLDMNGLMLCFEFNEGAPGGDNTGITQVADSKTGITAPLSNFALTGESSNFTEFIHTGYATLSESTCGEPYTSPSGNYTWTVSGTYADTVASSACKEILSIYLSVILLDTSVTQTSPGTLSANAAGAAYQWIDCDSGEPIAGATQKTFEATQTGNYAVVITQLGCSDTSSCYNLIINSTYAPLESGVKVYPNPASDRLTIELPGAHQETYALYDLMGRMLVNGAIFEEKTTLNLANFETGLYILEIQSTTSKHQIKILLTQNK
jgi:hypothetical protein